MKKKQVSVLAPKRCKKAAEYCNEKLGTIKIQSMRDYDACEITVETDDKTFLRVAEMGSELIKKDKNELFGYAIKTALTDAIRERAMK